MSNDPEIPPEEEDEPDDTSWMDTFADLSLLLLVFFILLYTLSSVNENKFANTFSSISRAIQGENANISASKVSRKDPGVILDQVMQRKQMIQMQQKVFTDVKTLQTTKGLEGLISANFEDGVITMNVPSDALFTIGEVTLSDKGKGVVRGLTNFFTMHPEQKIHIRGFTDNSTPSGYGRFKDNWEISSLRAVNVLREVLATGIPVNRLSATGLADINPLVPNTSEKNRSKNRRVEFILERVVTK